MNLILPSIGVSYPCDKVQPKVESQQSYKTCIFCKIYSRCLNCMCDICRCFCNNLVDSAYVKTSYIVGKKFSISIEIFLHHPHFTFNWCVLKFE